MNRFQIDKDQYTIDKFGVIHHENWTPYQYDENYVSVYDTEAYRRGSETLQALRLGFIIGACSAPQRLVDMGYGNGDFLKFASQRMRVYGNDVTGKPLEGIETGKDFPAADIYTFWDCLEHIPDLSFLRDLKTKYVAISLPYCHFHLKGLRWFTSWKHRKPNEHLHHFDRWSLSNMMQYYGYTVISTSTHEDIVRKPADELTNILTMAFRK